MIIEAKYHDLLLSKLDLTPVISLLVLTCFWWTPNDIGVMAGKLFYIFTSSEDEAVIWAGWVVLYVHTSDHIPSYKSQNKFKIIFSITEKESWLVPQIMFWQNKSLYSLSKSLILKAALVSQNDWLITASLVHQMRLIPEKFLHFKDKLCDTSSWSRLMCRWRNHFLLRSISSAHPIDFYYRL